MKLWIRRRIQLLSENDIIFKIVDNWSRKSQFLDTEKLWMKVRLIRNQFRMLNMIKIIFSWLADWKAAAAEEEAAADLMNKTSRSPPVDRRDHHLFDGGDDSFVKEENKQGNSGGDGVDVTLVLHFFFFLVKSKIRISLLRHNKLAFSNAEKVAVKRIDSQNYDAIYNLRNDCIEI